VTVCVAAVVALQHPALVAWMRAIGYVGVVALGSFLAFSASATTGSVAMTPPSSASAGSQYWEACFGPSVQPRAWLR